MEQLCRRYSYKYHVRVPLHIILVLASPIVSRKPFDLYSHIFQTVMKIAKGQGLSSTPFKLKFG